MDPLVARHGAATVASRIYLHFAAPLEMEKEACERLLLETVKSGWKRSG